MPPLRSLALYTRCRPDVPLLIIASAVLLYLGLSEPLMQTQTLWFWRNTLVIRTLIEDLWRRGDLALALLLLTLTVIFPALKLLALLLLWVTPFTTAARGALLDRIQFFSRWAMLDVFVVAVAAVLVQAGGLLKAEPRIGLYLFAMSLLLSMLATLIIHATAKACEKERRPSAR